MSSAERLRRRTAVAEAAAPRVALGRALPEAISALQDERLDEAQAKLDAVLARWPDQPDALHFLGVLRHAQGRHDEAVELIRRAIAAMPAASGPWMNLGNVLIGAGRLDEAVAAFERSAELAGDGPDAPGALSNLGVARRKLGRLAEAEAAIRRAVELRPDFAEGWYNLSRTLIDQGRIHEGLLANGRAVTLFPRHLMARDQVIRALLLLGERGRAAELYREWLVEDPDNPVVRHQLAACLGESPPARASDGYVEQVFDSFADSFDAKLEALDYRAPGLIAQALREVLGDPAGAVRDIVDLGCGTGLCGPLVQPWARHLAGCDLSVGMLRRARQRGVYDVLHKAELVHYLDTQPGQFDVAVSADTLCYFGDLAGVMGAAAVALRPGGWLFFTAEAMADDSHEPHRLQPSGRYVHGRAHIHQCIAKAGLQVHAVAEVVLRMEAGRPVDGWLVTARRP